MNAVHTGEQSNDARIAGLVNFTHQVVRKRGQVTAVDIQDFLEAGFTQDQVLEVLVGVSQAALASLVHHLAGTPVDEGFQPQRWAVPA